jgi:Holliday junction resolvase RusA-like endonuclease
MNAYFPITEPRLIVVTVLGAPVAKGRPKMTTRGKFPRVYTPAKTRAFEDLIRIEATTVMQDNPPVVGPVLLSVTAYVAMPKSLSKKARAEALDGIRKPVTRPDADNYAKAALDGCNGILFRDDSQVTDLIVRKRYSAAPRLVITMEVGDDFA